MLVLYPYPKEGFIDLDSGSLAKRNTMVVGQALCWK